MSGDDQVPAGTGAQVTDHRGLDVDQRLRHASTLPARNARPAGPFDERFVYRVTTEGKKALAEYERANGKPAYTKARRTPAVAEALDAEDWRERKRRRKKEARKRGLRLQTVYGRSRAGRKFPDLRMTGRWLERAGFPLGQEYEVEVEAGRLTLRAI